VISGRLPRISGSLPRISGSLPRISGSLPEPLPELGLAAAALGGG